MTVWLVSPPMNKAANDTAIIERVVLVELSG
jgi:hypothetical protein